MESRHVWLESNALIWFLSVLSTYQGMYVYHPLFWNTKTYFQTLIIVTEIQTGPRFIIFITVGHPERKFIHYLKIRRGKKKNKKKTIHSLPGPNFNTELGIEIFSCKFDVWHDSTLQNKWQLICIKFHKTLSHINIK